MKRIVRIIVGSIVLLVGLAMLILPGPALVVIPIGLAILAIDFPWATAMMQKVRLRFIRKRAPRPNH
jgi:tellurite resistance protein TerC